jgi:hypothetical protein
MSAGSTDRSLAAALDRVRHDPRASDTRDRFVANARHVAEKPIIQRVYGLEDVGKKGRSWLDGRTWISPANTREAFALAMSDFMACNTLRSELPLLAGAYRLTGERSFLDRVLAQLEELAGWSPLQRPGWTLYHAGAKPLADPKGDGNWLATGVGILAIIETLEILPESSRPAGLLARLNGLLAKEIEGCLDDWTVRRPWFYRPPNPFTNQWVLPTAGYLLACLHLGRDRYADGYELGLEHLAMSLDACGNEGAFAEGLHYSSVTVEVLLSTARILALAGDDRLAGHPFLKQYPSWVVQHYQPGGHFINSFDAFSAAAVPVVNGRRSSVFQRLLALCALCTGARDACWAVHTLEAEQLQDLNGLLAQSVPPVADGYAPPLWAVYDEARRVNWRSSWMEDASGVWVRGGHPSDQHDHADRGHVNFICRGKPLLIEAGTPAYHSPRLAVDYAGGRGHNVLQVGERLPANRTTVPITVERLDAKGGEVRVDATASFKEGLRRWARHVRWDADCLTVEDDVEPSSPDILLFRWHLGSTEPPAVGVSEGGYRVSWSGGDVRIVSDVPIRIATESMPDHTLRARDWDDPSPDSLHTCLLIRTDKPEARARVTVTVEGRH